MVGRGSNSIGRPRHGEPEIVIPRPSFEQRHEANTVHPRVACRVTSEGRPPDVAAPDLALCRPTGGGVIQDDTEVLGGARDFRGLR